MKLRSIVALSGVVGVVVAAGWSAEALAQLDPNGTGNCRVGTTVQSRDGKVGRVETAEGSSCWVRFADGTKHYYLQWMLTPVAGGANRSAGGQAAAKSGAGGAVRPGNYQCYGGPAGNMRITLDGSGRWNEFYARTLPDGKVGITGRPGAPAYMVCERR